MLKGKSPVNAYNLLALENSKEGLTEERIGLAFQAFDELIPKLGVFMQIFQKLRIDLFAAVYSDELTVTAEKHADGDSGYIQRLPYFSLVKQFCQQRHNYNEELEEQLDNVNKKLLEKNKLLEEAQEVITAKEGLISALSTTALELESVIGNKDKQINELQCEFEKASEMARSIQVQLERNLTELQESLKEARIEIGVLSRFKNGYDDLYNAFLDKSNASDCELKKNTKLVRPAKQFTPLNDAEAGQKLEEQILAVINITIDEYDKSLESHNSCWLETGFIADRTSTNLDLEDLDETNQKFEDAQLKFQNSVGSLMTELQLLQQHNRMHVEQLQMINETTPNACKAKETRDIDGIGRLSLADNLMMELDKGIDPFVPHETVFSKYAAVIYTSIDHGKTFEVLKEINFCLSCGEKTVICPHKIGGPDKVFTLPHNCSHIKLTRPKVKTNKDHKFVSGKHKDQTQAIKTSNTLPSADIIGSVHTVQRLWDDYRHRTSIERTVPRSLDLERTRSILEQFFCYLVWTDDFLTHEEANLSVLEMFYSFMLDRYCDEDVMFMAAHDFLSAVEKFSEQEKMFHLLEDVFVGNLDAACFRYVLLMCDFITLVTWQNVEDFRAFSSAVYPFLSDDDLESLQLSYTAYSENKISGQLIASFIIHIIQNQREPRFQYLENKLVEYGYSKQEQLKDNEFKAALDTLLPLCSEKIRQRLYLQSERAGEWEGITGTVPIKRLAQISGFLELQQISVVVKATVVQRVNEWRERPNSAALGRQQVITTTEVKSPDKLLTMGHVKKLAANFNKKVQHRKIKQ
ncbi:hypothetical protein BsWGS_04794 [Bradybaena similaris]